MSSKVEESPVFVLHMHAGAALMQDSSHEKCVEVIMECNEPAALARREGPAGEAAAPTDVPSVPLFRDLRSMESGLSDDVPSFHELGLLTKASTDSFLEARQMSFEGQENLAALVAGLKDVSLKGKSPSASVPADGTTCEAITAVSHPTAFSAKAPHQLKGGTG